MCINYLFEIKRYNYQNIFLTWNLHSSYFNFKNTATEKTNKIIIDKYDILNAPPYELYFWNQFGIKTTKNPRIKLIRLQKAFRGISILY